MSDKKVDPKLSKIAEQKGKSPQKVDAKLLKEYKGKGAKLPYQKELEAAFGADLSKVRIHSDDEAAKLCKEMGAKSFARGSDIFFEKASAAKDKNLLAHELTHVVQSNGKVRK